MHLVTYSIHLNQYHRMPFVCRHPQVRQGGGAWGKYACVCACVYMMCIFHACKPKTAAWSSIRFKWFHTSESMVCNKIWIPYHWRRIRHQRSVQLRLKVLNQHDHQKSTVAHAPDNWGHHTYHEYCQLRCAYLDVGHPDGQNDKLLILFNVKGRSQHGSE